MHTHLFINKYLLLSTENRIINYTVIVKEILALNIIEFLLVLDILKCIFITINVTCLPFLIMITFKIL